MEPIIVPNMQTFRECIIDQYGEPVAGVAVTVLTETGMPVQTVPSPVRPTDENGEFSFAAPNGRYRVSLTHPDLNGGQSKELFTTLYDPSPTNVAEALKGILLDQSGKVLATKICAHRHTPADVTRYLHRQMVASNEWTVIHNLRCFPVVTIFDSPGDGVPVLCDVVYVDLNTLKVIPELPMSGEAYLL